MHAASTLQSIHLCIKYLPADKVRLPFFLWCRYKAELTDVRSVIERQKAEILALSEEVEGLRSGQSLVRLQARVEELEQQVL